MSFLNERKKDMVYNKLIVNQKLSSFSVLIMNRIEYIARNILNICVTKKQLFCISEK